MKPTIVTLSTDFGTRDGFVGIMKGVLLSIAPHVQIVDMSHGIRPQDVLEGQFLLQRAVPYFPKGTIHVAVIDPGVGTSRRPIVVEAKLALFVGPDNGLFTPWLKGANVYHLNKEKYFLDHPSATFHGRDIFSPVAAHLANGVPPGKMGVIVKDPVVLEIPKPKIKAGTIRGEVIHVDNFGNLITNIPAGALAEFIPDKCAPVITIANEKICGMVKTYGSQPAMLRYEASGQAGRPALLIALIGSHGYLEVAVPMGNAQKVLNAQRGDTVTVRGK